jgi:hypothetical protein
MEIEEIIPVEELEKQIVEIIEEYVHAEDILAKSIDLDGRNGVGHRTLRDFVGFIHDVIFEDEFYNQYNNFKYAPDHETDAESILRWSALYLIETKR